MIVATDLDRTLIPNGKEEYDGTLAEFFELYSKVKFTLVYVSGRNLYLLDEAVSEYGISYPDWFIAEVGTRIYGREGARLVKDEGWSAEIAEKSPEWNWTRVKNAIGNENVLTLQEGWKQNEYKLSYYLDDFGKKENELKHIRDTLKSLGVDADVIYSVDEIAGRGLIDVIPRSATKVMALEYIRKKLGAEMGEVIYCGDSGNDLLPLMYGYKAILVKNAREEIKEAVRGESRVYIAKGLGRWNGNYVSGILEGLKHYGLL